MTNKIKTIVVVVDRTIQCILEFIISNHIYWSEILPLLNHRKKTNELMIGKGCVETKCQMTPKMYNGNQKTRNNDTD